MGAGAPPKPLRLPLPVQPVTQRGSASLGEHREERLRQGREGIGWRRLSDPGVTPVRRVQKLDRSRRTAGYRDLNQAAPPIAAAAAGVVSSQEPINQPSALDTQSWTRPGPFLQPGCEEAAGFHLRGPEAHVHRATSVSRVV